MIIKFENGEEGRGMTDTEIVDWMETHEGKYTKGFLDWYTDGIGRFISGKDLRDCVEKAKEREDG